MKIILTTSFELSIGGVKAAKNKCAGVHWVECRPKKCAITHSHCTPCLDYDPTKGIEESWLNMPKQVFFQSTHNYCKLIIFCLTPMMKTQTTSAVVMSPRFGKVHQCIPKKILQVDWKACRVRAFLRATQQHGVTRHSLFCFFFRKPYRWHSRLDLFWIFLVDAFHPTVW